MHELADGEEDRSDGFIVAGKLFVEPSFELCEAASQFPVRSEHLTQLDEGAHYIDTHFDGARAAQDRGGHDSAVLGEGVGRKARIAMLPGTGRILRPVQGYCLGLGQSEYEIRGEARGIAFDLLVEALGSHPVERGEFGIEQNPMAA